MARRPPLITCPHEVKERKGHMGGASPYQRPHAPCRHCRRALRIYTRALSAPAHTAIYLQTPTRENWPLKTPKAAGDPHKEQDQQPATRQVRNLLEPTRKCSGGQWTRRGWPNRTKASCQSHGPLLSANLHSLATVLRNGASRGGAADMPKALAAAFMFAGGSTMLPRSRGDSTMP